MQSRIDILCGLETRLRYFFRDVSLLETALTHSSYANENRSLRTECNERLEFLGDSVLGVTVADYLYRHYTAMPEGKMTRLRSELVCEQSLYHVARRIGLGECLRLGRGEERNGGRERPSILSDAVEAVIAALYLDGGMEQASRFIHENLLDSLGEQEPSAYSDYKTALQEEIQRQSGQSLVYELVGESGPDHDKTFSVRVLLNGGVLGEGSGRTKKEAEQISAKNALEALGK